MNCQNCGKDEVNFHFTSNINGNMTEKHLCAECAENLGFSEKLLNKPEASFEEIFSELFGGKPSRRMLGGYGLVFPTFIIPTMGMLVPEKEYAGYRENSDDRPEATPVEIKPEVDTQMQRRREVNVMREQMRKAAADEDFERAASLRDTIKRLENSQNS